MAACGDRTAKLVASHSKLKLTPASTLPRALFLDIHGIQKLDDDDTFDTIRTACAAEPGQAATPRASADGVADLATGVCSGGHAIVAPGCDRCLPGQVDIASGCKAYTPEVAALVKSVRGLLKGDEFYPYLASETLAARQVIAASILARERPRRVLDVGFYWRPIYRFLHSFCPDEVVNLDPVADPVSAVLPCPAGTRTSGGRDTMVIHTMPMGLKEFSSAGGMEPSVSWGKQAGKPEPGPMVFDSIVCVGCEADFVKAPDLEVFPRPYSLLIEWPREFEQSARQYKKLSGTKRFEVDVNAIGVSESTKYTTRSVNHIVF